MYPLKAPGPRGPARPCPEICFPSARVSSGGGFGLKAIVCRDCTAIFLARRLSPCCAYGCVRHRHKPSLLRCFGGDKPPWESRGALSPFLPLTLGRKFGSLRACFGSLRVQQINLRKLLANWRWASYLQALRFRNSVILIKVNAMSHEARIESPPWRWRAPHAMERNLSLTVNGKFNVQWLQNLCEGVMI